MAKNADFHIKQGNTSPALEAQLIDNEGNPVDLNGTTVRFQSRLVGDDIPTVDDTAKITDPDEGIVVYEWKSGDTDTDGSYIAEFDVDYSGGTSDNFESDETFPNNDYLQIRIEENL